MLHGQVCLRLLGLLRLVLLLLLDLVGLLRHHLLLLLLLLRSKEGQLLLRGAGDLRHLLLDMRWEIGHMACAGGLGGLLHGHQLLLGHPWIGLQNGHIALVLLLLLLLLLVE
jgi:hypothetical protein